MNLNDLKILQWNARGINKKRHELIKILNEFDADIIVIVESLLNSNIRLTLKNYAVIRHDRTTNKGGGLCIFIRKNIMFKVIDSFIDIPDVLENKNILLFPESVNPILISSIYRPPHDNFDNNLWNLLFQKLHNFTSVSGIKTVLLGDFNCHHYIWELQASNDNIGSKLHEQIEDSNLILLNNGSRTYLNNNLNKVSAVDLTLVSSDLIASSSWSVASDTFSSDHFPIFIKIILNSNYTKLNEFSYKINLRNVDWVEFRKQLVSKIDDFGGSNFSDKSVHDKYDYYIDTILDSIHHSKPHSKKKPDELKKE